MPNVGQHLLFVGQWIHRRLGRPEHELENLLVQRLVRQPAAAAGEAASTAGTPAPHPEQGPGEVDISAAVAVVRTAPREQNRNQHDDESHEVHDQGCHDGNLEKKGEPPPQRVAQLGQPLAQRDRIPPRERGIELIDQFAALGGGQVTAKFLEQAGQRFLGHRYRQAGFRNCVGLGQLTTLALQGFKQNATRVALGVRLCCKGGFGPHVPCHASHWRNRQDVLSRLHGRDSRLYLLGSRPRHGIGARKGTRWTRISLQSRAGLTQQWQRCPTAWCSMPATGGSSTSTLRPRSSWACRVTKPPRPLMSACAV